MAENKALQASSSPTARPCITTSNRGVTVRKADWPTVEGIVGQATEVLDLLALEVEPGLPGDPSGAVQNSLEADLPRMGH